MNTYKLKQCENGDIYVDNDSPMYPSSFEEKINKLAGEKITEIGPSMDFMFDNFVNTFVIKKDKFDLFKKKVVPYIGFKSGSPEIGPAKIWDKDEEIEG